MDHQSRRAFLGTMAGLGGAALLRPFDLFAAEPTSPPAMTIARWAAIENESGAIAVAATKLTEQAMQAIGGMGRFVSKDAVVWIKPNIGWARKPELAACTNPDVVATLTRLCLNAGAKKVKVGDYTCHDARRSYRNSGIEAAAKEAGAEVVYIDDRRFRDIKIGGERLEEWPIYPEIIETDLVINVPIVKHHGLSRATVAMKNYMGIIGGQRNSWHQALPECLVDITRYMKPRLCVLDAVRILTDHGPQGGNPSDVELTGVVAAGTDIVAIDAFGVELLGHDPSEIQTVKKAHEAGLGEIDFRQKLAVEELTVS